jgi:hypothetical protein
LKVRGYRLQVGNKDKARNLKKKKFVLKRKLNLSQDQIDHQFVGQAVKVILKGFSGANEKFYNFLLENFSHPVSGKLF